MENVKNIRLFQKILSNIHSKYYLVFNQNSPEMELYAHSFNSSNPHILVKKSDSLVAIFKAIIKNGSMPKVLFHSGKSRVILDEVIQGGNLKMVIRYQNRGLEEGAAFYDVIEHDLNLRVREFIATQKFDLFKSLVHQYNEENSFKPKLLLAV